jgi:hypothetical protein
MASAWTGTDPSVWGGRTKGGLTALLRNSVQDLASEAGRTIPNGGRVPVKTGNLARSVVVSKTRPNILLYGPPDPNALSGIATINPGDPIFLGWQAAYSRRQNSGYVGTDSLGRTYNQAGHGFAEATAAQWPAIVARNAAKMGGR